MWHGWCAIQLITFIFNAIAWRVLTVVTWVWKLFLMMRPVKKVKEEENEPSLHVGDALGWQ